MSVHTRAIAVLAAGVALSALAAGAASAHGAVPLNNEQETTGATGGGSGFFTYELTDTTLCYTLEVRNLTAAPVGAHIHLGPRGMAGPVTVGLTTPSGATGGSHGCILAEEGGEMTPDELAAIAADPKAHYVNVHTPTFTGGEVRGQLKK